MPALDFFLRHAYLILFGWVLGEQLGVPVPSVPLLITVGTLIAAHRMSGPASLLCVLCAAILGDSFWYALGKRYGSRVLELLCRLSFESNTCVAKTEGYFEKRGPSTLLIAKFVPGLNTVAPPIAGELGMPFGRFLLYDSAGILLWASAALCAGYFFGDIVRRNAMLLGLLAHFALAIFIVNVAGYIIFRFVQQRKFLRFVRENRMEIDELKAMIDAGEKPFIVDLRHPLDYLPDPRVLPGAVRIGPADLAAHKEVIPLDRDVILYCTCPSEQTSAKLALDLRRIGVTRVRPLKGGFDGWKEAGYALEEYVPAAKPSRIAKISR
ncbi:MAG TPA: VTT domain-containing protein [Acidobacteriaceae bacterium]|jgi:membrane protein DedA with SNARE-associated domain/rhodanese-related sulfurtransferase|nr:VTT domain-containing protein [Acidobacteriaceae bacterium]